MISASNATDAAVIEAFAGIPAVLDQTPALIAQDRLPDCECLLGPVSLQAGQAGRVQGDLHSIGSTATCVAGWRGSILKYARR